MHIPVQRHIAQSRHAGLRITMLSIAALCLTASLNIHADVSGLKGVAVSQDPQVLQRIATLEFRLQQMEKRTAKLEREVNKPDSPDDKDEDKKKDQDKGSQSGESKNAGKNADAGADGKKSGDSKDADGNLKDVLPVMTLRAPFVVVDAAGKPIFRVADPHAKGSPALDRGVYVYGEGGTSNFELATVYGGGRLLIQANGNARSIALGAVDDGAGARVRVGKQTKTFMGVNQAGSPLMMVYADGESPAAGLQLDQGKGQVAVFNGNQPVAMLRQSHAHPGGGNMTTTDPSGNTVFSGGYSGEGGDACVWGKNGVHCVGVGLPLGAQ